jgi:hypothetical protein
MQIIGLAFQTVLATLTLATVIFTSQSAIAALAARRRASMGISWRRSAAAWAKQVMSRVGTRRSSFAGPRGSSIGCRHSLPIWCAAKLR